MRHMKGYLLADLGDRDVTPVYAEDPRRTCFSLGDEILMRMPTGEVWQATALCEIQYSLDEEVSEAMVRKVAKRFNLTKETMPVLVGTVVRMLWTEEEDGDEE